jgi:hypothetical protein
MFQLLRRQDETLQRHVDVQVSLTRTTERSLDAVGGFMSQRYCGRRLRGLSERVWLGAPLLALISKDQLADVARLADTGSSVRIDLLPGQGLGRLEEVLTPILPVFKA